MSMALDRNRLAAAVASISVLGSLGLSAPAHADPIPVPPNCNGEFLFETPGLDLTQDDGTDVFPAVAQSGKTFTGGVYYLAGAARKKTTGKVSGGQMEGDQISFTANWDTGGWNKYTGTINPDTSMSGVTTSNAGVSENWRSGAGSLKCQPGAMPGGGAIIVTPAPGVTPAPFWNTANVKDDAYVFDVKDVPQGTGHVLGTVRRGTQVVLIGDCPPTDWCQISNAEIHLSDGSTKKNVQGWVGGIALTPNQ
jgi:hypothetical protein